MSKVVKKVGRHFKKIWSGVNKLRKKIQKSKVFKVIATAAAIYFTGGAVLGAMGGASAGLASGGLTGALSGAVSGAGAGIASAWGGITGAASAVAGGSFTGAGSALAGGITGASAAGAGTVAGIAGTAGAVGGAGAAGQVLSASQQAALNMTGNGMGGFTGLQSAPKAAPGFFGGLLNSVAKNPYALPMMMQVGGNMISQGAQAKAVEEQTEDERKRYNINIGTRLYGPMSSGYAGATVPSGIPGYTIPNYG